MNYLPLFIDLRDKPCLLVGGGEIARRKLELLLRAGAAVEIVAPAVGEETRALAQQHGVTVLERPFDEADAAGRYLLVAATDDTAVNEAVFRAGMARHTLVNSVDQPALSSAIFPAIVDRSPVLVAISTGGRSPTLARLVRSWIEARLPARLGNLATFIGERRDLVKQRLQGIPARPVATSHLRRSCRGGLSRRRRRRPAAFRYHAGRCRQRRCQTRTGGAGGRRPRRP